MEFFKRIVWIGVLLLLLVILGFGGFTLRNGISAKNNSDYWQERALENGEFVYVALGDSIALGVGSSVPANSYVGILKSRIEETTGKSVKIVNLSTADATTKSVIDDQIPKLSNYKPDLVTVSVGMNDVNGSVRDSVIEENLKTLVSLLPDHVSYMAEIPYTYDKKKNERIEEINKALAEAAEPEGVNMVPLYTAVKQGIGGLSYYDWDFKNPNDKGHELWADTFWNVIQ